MFYNNVQTFIFTGHVAKSILDPRVLQEFSNIFTGHVARGCLPSCGRFLSLASLKVIQSCSWPTNFPKSNLLSSNQVLITPQSPGTWKLGLLQAHNYVCGNLLSNIPNLLSVTVNSFWFRSGPSKPNQRKVSSWTFHRGIPEQKFNVNRSCFPSEKTPEFNKLGESHELFVLALWFGLQGRFLIGAPKQS